MSDRELSKVINEFVEDFDDKNEYHVELLHKAKNIAQIRSLKQSLGLE